MISIREEVTVAMPPDVLWRILSDPAAVASCIPGAVLTKSGEDGTYLGTMRVKFGPTVALFRGEAKLAYDHAGRRCTIQGRGIDGRGASRGKCFRDSRGDRQRDDLVESLRQFQRLPGRSKPLQMRAECTSL